MPEFLDYLVDDIRSKLSVWQDAISGKLDEGFVQMLESVIATNWNDLTIETPVPPEGVIGTDGSRSTRVLWSGTVWWIVRALAIHGEERARVFDSGFMPSGTTEQDSQWYLTLRMEGAENAAALKAAEEFNGNMILVDGSLFGRLQHIPMELKIIRDRDYLLTYYDQLLQLLDICRTKNIGLIGISKDSGINQFTKYLLLQRTREVFKNATEKVNLSTRRAIYKCILHPNDPEGSGYSLFKKLNSNTGSTWKILTEILRLALIPITDHVLMQSLLKGKGYTTPLLMSLNQSSRTTFQSAIQNTPEFISTRFAKSISESEDPKEYKKHAIRVISRLKDLPAVVTFHIRLHPKDTPLRVDVPSWMVGNDSKIWEIDRPKAIQCNLSEILKVLTGGYGGLQNYNIWQKRADELVRLHRDTVDSLYKTVIEQELGQPIEFRRGYRRVYYP